MSVRFPGDIDAVRGVSLTIEEGERIAILGANGAGKSSLLLAAAGLVPFEGEVIVDGTTLRRSTSRALRPRIGFLFQNPDDQLFLPTLGEDVAFGPRELRLSEDDVLRRVAAALDAAGLRGAESRNPHRLSGGEKRAAALATVLAMEPGLLLLDEPTTGLDARAARSVVAKLSRLDATLVIATHDLDVARALATRAIVLESGEMRADGSIEDLLDDRDRLERFGLA
ncbi:MAG: ABC transporter ATP-binding protein [Planctomycetes bacterium]|nr:ABC transporter ATP-binding protein [Planctomycetota bacterium]MBI3848350.1 ABC transporter ATP-binding protein [Planctomycetota bacterium]